MERVYVLSRMSKCLCWLEIAWSAGVAAWLVGFVAYHLYRWVIKGFAGGAKVPLLSLVFLAVAIIPVLLLRSALRKLRFRLAISDDAITMGENVVPWDWVDRIDRIPASLVEAFSVHTWKGRNYSVPVVEQAGELEDFLRARLLSGDVSASGISRHDFPREHRLRLTILHVLLGVIAWVCCIGIFVSPGGAFLRPFYIASERAKRLAASSVATFDQAIRIGDDVLRWEDIGGIEPSGRRGVAFLVRKRGGEKLKVYAGIENWQVLESSIEDRLASADSN